MKTLRRAEYLILMVLTTMLAGLLVSCTTDLKNSEHMPLSMRYGTFEARMSETRSLFSNTNVTVGVLQFDADGRLINPIEYNDLVAYVQAANQTGNPFTRVVIASLGWDHSLSDSQLDYTEFLKTYFAQSIGTPTLKVEDFLDLPTFARELGSPTLTNAAVAFLRTNLTSETLEELKHYHSRDSLPKQLQEDLVDDLNQKILSNPSTYEATCFRSVHLREETRKHLPANHPGDTELLNRMLLEDAFPYAIWRNSHTGLTSRWLVLCICWPSGKDTLSSAFKSVLPSRTVATIIGTPLDWVVLPTTVWASSGLADAIGGHDLSDALQYVTQTAWPGGTNQPTIYLVGHSFGTRILTGALGLYPLDPYRRYRAGFATNSLSNYSFRTNIAGAVYIEPAMSLAEVERITNFPVFVTQSRHDQLNGTIYPLANIPYNFSSEGEMSETVEAVDAKIYGTQLDSAKAAALSQGVPELTLANFAHLPDFATRLKKPANPVETFLNGALKPETHSELSHYSKYAPVPAKLCNHLLRDLNELMDTNLFQQMDHLNTLNLSAETTNFLAKFPVSSQPDRDSLRHLNQLLLADAFTPDIRLVPPNVHVQDNWAVDVGVELEGLVGAVPYSAERLVQAPYSAFELERQQKDSSLIMDSLAQVPLVEIPVEYFDKNAGVHSKGIFNLGRYYESASRVGLSENRTNLQALIREFNLEQTPDDVPINAQKGPYFVDCDDAIDHAIYTKNVDYQHHLGWNWSLGWLDPIGSHIDYNHIEINRMIYGVLGGLFTNKPPAIIAPPIVSPPPSLATSSK